MPDLPITDDEVNGAARNRMVLAKIEAVMLWPDDPAARGVAYQAAWTQFCTPPGAPQEVTAARQASQQDVQRCFRQGVAAGKILHNALGRPEVGETDFNLNALKTDAARLLELGSVKNMDNVHWRKMRPVAHLWAAYYACGISERDAPFPCRLEAVDLFLSHSMKLLRLGNERQTKQSPTPGILRFEDAWIVPPSVQLPDIEISYHRPN
jgi:hypothetical protein